MIGWLAKPTYLIDSVLCTLFVQNSSVRFIVTIFFKKSGQTSASFLFNITKKVVGFSGIRT